MSVTLFSRTALLPTLTSPKLKVRVVPVSPGNVPPDMLLKTRITLCVVPMLELQQGINAVSPYIGRPARVHAVLTRRENVLTSVRVPLALLVRIRDRTWSVVRTVVLILPPVPSVERLSYVVSVVTANSSVLTITSIT